MSDRFKIRAWSYLTNTMFQPVYIVPMFLTNTKRGFMFSENIIYLDFKCQNHYKYGVKNSRHPDYMIIEPEWNGSVLMQCIGQKDKNGKLIYDGDIVKHTWYQDNDCGQDYKIEDIYQVYFCEKTASFEAKELDVLSSGFVDLKDLLEDLKNVEIIGNIYENKELLEGGAE